MKKLTEDIEAEAEAEVKAEREREREGIKHILKRRSMITN